MSAFWSKPASAVDIDAELNARLADLAEALAPAFDGRPLVFHDARGHAAPAIDDPERTHVQIHGVPAPADAVPDAAPDQGRRFSPDIFRTEASLPCLEPWIGPDPDAPNTDAPETDASDITLVPLLCTRNWRSLAQAVNGTLFLLARPAADGQEDGPIDLDVIADMLIHAAAQRHDSNLEVQRHRPMRGHDEFLHALRRHAPLTALADWIERRRLQSSMQCLLERIEPADGTAALKSELEQARRDATELEARERDVRDSLEKIRRRAADAIRASRGTDMKDQMRADLARIRAMPQVMRADRWRHDGQTWITVHLRPMAMGRDQHRSVPGTATLAPLRVDLPLDPREGNSVRVKDLYGSRTAAGHVRRTPCLGSVSEPLQECLMSGQYANATQLMIAFLQTFDPEDEWGRVGLRWPGFDLDPAHGDVMRLPLPETTDGGAPTTNGDTSNGDT